MTLPNNTIMKTTLIIKQNNIGNKNDTNIDLNK